MEILVIVLSVCAAVLSVVGLLLFVPMGYRAELADGILIVSVTAFFGLWRKQLYRSVEEGKENTKETTEDAENEGNEDTEENVKGKPSFSKQIRFAWKNGALQDVTGAAGKLFRHSRPRRWSGEIRFGTGDPMETGCIAGIVWALMPGLTEYIRWEYTEKVNYMWGSAEGRIMPAYVLWVFLCLYNTRSVRAWRAYRKGEEL